jgi:hypothetical protein
MIEKLDLLDSSIGSLSSYEAIENKINEIIKEVNVQGIMLDRMINFPDVLGSNAGRAGNWRKQTEEALQ